MFSGRHAEADETFEAILRSDDRSMVLGALSYKAMSLYLRGALDAADALATRAIENPSPVLLVRACAYVVRGRVALARGDVARAREALEGGAAVHARIALMHERVELHLLRHDVLMAEGREDEAAAEIAEARRWVLARAATLDDTPDRKRSFLTQTPWNARVMALSAARGE